jgi:signal peptidase II
MRANSRLLAAAIGLLISGAAGNAIDRALYGAVVDFVLLHWGNWRWYVFNIADVAIVAGVIGLLYDAFTARATK